MRLQPSLDHPTDGEQNIMSVTLTLSNSKSNMLISNTIKSTHSIAAVQCYTDAAIVVVKCFPADGPPLGAIYPSVIGRFVQLHLSQKQGPSTHNAAKCHSH